jgi:uncharacterized protein
VNRLAGERSPYLLQHASNPVDWHPWGDEAFEKARREDKPVFLSIGYSSCHWCHVMERESFADGEVARALNETFVCVKVDREERPDIDRHYMAVCQALTGAGGWPLTVVTAPDRRAFFAGTYFPKSRRWGRPGLLDLVPLIAEAWRTRRAEVLRSAGEIVDAVESPRTRGRAGAAASLTAATLGLAFRELRADFDAAHGGFGDAPKFPLAHQIGFLLGYGKRTGDGEARSMAAATLDAMSHGGICDHLGGGFHRYATDPAWRVPHFEKMLYDQALLAEVYAESFLATGNAAHRRTAVGTADYVLRDLAAPEGGFYAAEDADSEGEEGRFYLWTTEEVRAVLTAEEAELAVREFHLEDAGNFAEPGRGRDGRNVLFRAGSGGLGEGGAAARFDSVRDKLLRARGRRPRPFLDTKVLADWNGLMIASLAAVSRATGRDGYLRAAAAAADFALDRLRDAGGELFHVFAGGTASVPGFLDDHAFMIKGLTALYEAGFEPRYLESALDLADRAVRAFWDDEEGGFSFTARAEAGGSAKEIYDGALPSGNSVMFGALLRLARLTGRRDLEDRASRLASAFAAEVAAQPRLYAEFLCGLDYALGPSREVVIVGRTDAAATLEMLAALRAADRRDTAGLFKPTDREDVVRAVERLAPFTRAMDAGGGPAAAYVCSEGACRSPVASAAGLVQALSPSPAPTGGRRRTLR